MKYFQQTTGVASLAAFRILFGLLMTVSMVRFWSRGWIEKLYLQPDFHFSYWGFEWVRPLGDWTYFLFVLCGLSAFMVALGWRYRLSICTFFLSFTYIELMDKTTYLNHYYFISLVAFLLCFLPAASYYSVDAIRSKERRSMYIRRYQLDVVKLLIGIVYFYAGLAKLHPDWLFEAQPLRTWLASKQDLPLLGVFFGKVWVAYLFSWMGAIYDLSIPFLLLYSRTRLMGFVLVVVFHVLTRILFPIGMFPYIMIASSLIFFSSSFHERWLDGLMRLLSIPEEALDRHNFSFWPRGWERIYKFFLIGFVIVQLIVPFRHLLYPGTLFWTEEGYRFSWRVMLMDKAGSATFKVVDSIAGSSFVVRNEDFLTPLQEKQMATQPDFILEYAHFLRDHFSSQGHQNIQLFVDSFVSLNGRPIQRLVDPDEDLASHGRGWQHKTWILPYEK